MTLVAGLARESDVAHARIFEAIPRILGGDPGERTTLDPGTSKMLCILLGGDFTGQRGSGPLWSEAEIDDEQFLLHFGDQRRRKPLSYFPTLARSVVRALMALAGLPRIAEPVVAVLPAGSLPRVRAGNLRVGGFLPWSYPTRVVWFVPRPTWLRIVVRHNVENSSSLWSGPIPMGGPLALPSELAPWAPPPRQFDDFSPPLTCPACGACASRYRRIDTALVCSSCNRSFEH